MKVTKSVKTKIGAEKLDSGLEVSQAQMDQVALALSASC